MRSSIARTRLGVAELYRRSLHVELEQGLGAPILRPALAIGQPDSD
jgi:hypothetical protein